MENLLIKACEKQGFKIVYKDIDQVSEEEFKQIRMDWFGASDSSKLLDVNPFPNGTKKDLVKEKLTNEVDESIGKKASVRMGKDIEHIIMDKVEKYLRTFHNKPLAIIKPSNMYGMYESMLGTNFDGVYVTPDIVFPIEIKAVTKYGRKYYDFKKSCAYQIEGEWQPNRPIVEVCQGTDYENIAHSLGIPVYYYTQTQQQILTAGSNFALLAVMDVDNWDIHIFYIPRNESCIQELINTGTEEALKIRTIKKLKK